MIENITRRTVLGGIAATSAVIATGDALGLKPGEFQWDPDRSPQGPVAIIVSLPDQLVHVYRNGVQIGLSTCSTGKPGHSTPAGVFTVLQKDAHHHSSTYNDASMPNMNRLTWSGIALHAGNLPGYPASHGCVRLPLEFSKLLFGVTHVGTAVIIADDHSQPAMITHPGPMLSDLAQHEMEAAVMKVAGKSLPQVDETDTQHVSVLISGADREIYILKDGAVVAKGPVEIVNGGRPLGSHVFTLTAAHDATRSLQWSAINFKTPEANTETSEAAADILSRLKPTPDIAREIISVQHPGLVLTLTDKPAHPETRSGRDFVVMATSES